MCALAFAITESPLVASILPLNVSILYIKRLVQFEDELDIE
jgi:hypothetical protein